MTYRTKNCSSKLKCTKWNSRYHNCYTKMRKCLKKVFKSDSNVITAKVSSKYLSSVSQENKDKSELIDDLLITHLWW